MRRMVDQRDIELRMLDGSVLRAAAVGNNAAWNCPCNYPTPLVGSLVIAATVECPGCERSYRVLSDDPRLGIKAARRQ